MCEKRVEFEGIIIEHFMDVGRQKVKSVGFFSLGMNIEHGTFLSFSLSA